MQNTEYRILNFILGFKMSMNIITNEIFILPYLDKEEHEMLNK